MIGTVQESVAVTPPPRGGATGWIAIGILLLLTVLSHVDRSVISLMVDPIKRDLHLSDIQFSLLQGFAFALFYAFVSLPMSWVGDRFSRHWVIFLGTTAWSICTALCGLANNFWMLFLARLGVGAGEATLGPSSYAMVGDLFPPQRLALAVGVLAAGAAIGGSAALAIGGFVVQWAETARPVAGLASWQFVFMLVGLPGIFLAGLVFIIPRTQHRIARPAGTVTGGTAMLGPWLRRRKAYLATLYLGVGFHAVLAYGLVSWVPTYFIRHFGLSAAETGLTLGLVQGISGPIGYIGGGWLADNLHARGVRDAHYRYFSVNCLLIGIIGIVAFAFVESYMVLLILLALLNMLLPFTGPAVAHLQISSPYQLRARTVAGLMLVFTLIGMTLGPASVAVFTEKLFGGPQNVGYGLALMFGIFAPLGLLCFLLGIRPARRALESGAEHAAIA